MDFIATPPPLPTAFDIPEDCGVKIFSVSIRASSLLYTVQLTHFSQLQSPSINAGILPADGPGSESFSNLALVAFLLIIPALISYLLSATYLTTSIVFLLTISPLLSSFWYLSSIYTPRKNMKVKLPGRPIESYLTFNRLTDKAKYCGQRNIPIDTFQELYFNGDVEFNGDCLEVLEYRHDWANFHFTFRLFKYFLLSFIPEVIMHTRSQGKNFRKTLPFKCNKHS